LETGQINRRIEVEPIWWRTERAFLKSRDSTKMFRRSDFRNARSVRWSNDSFAKPSYIKILKSSREANGHPANSQARIHYAFRLREFRRDYMAPFRLARMLRVGSNKKLAASVPP
jgi:hypothetical protein